MIKRPKASSFKGQFRQLMRSVIDVTSLDIDLMLPGKVEHALI